MFASKIQPADFTDQMEGQCGVENCSLSELIRTNIFMKLQKIKDFSFFVFSWVYFVIDITFALCFFPINFYFQCKP